LDIHIGSYFLSLKIIWIVQNYVPKNISIIQNTKSPFISSPFDKGGFRGILICFYFICREKFIEKLIIVKENIKMDKSLCIDSWGHFFDLTIITLGT
jgi:hypothetical protein